MDEVIVIENSVSVDGVRRVHLMSNGPLCPADISPEYSGSRYDGRARLLDHRAGYLGESEVEIVKEAGVWHLRAEWPCRGLIQINCEGWPCPKEFVVWSLAGCASVTAALFGAAKEFERIYEVRPQYAFIRRMPRGVENAHEIGELMLFEAEWMINKCVAVGRFFEL